MKEISKSSLEEAYECFKKYHTSLPFLKLTIMGFKQEKKIYTALGVKIEFLAKPKQKSEVVFKTQNSKLIVYQEVKSINIKKLRNLLEDIEKHTIMIEDYTFNLDYFNEFDFISSIPSFLDYHSKWPIFILTSSSKNKYVKDFIERQECIEYINREGYNSLTELSQKYFDCNIALNGWPLRFYMIIPVYILLRFEKRKREISFILECHESMNIKEIDISTNIEKESNKRIQFNFDKTDRIEEKKKFLKYKKTMEIKNGDMEYIKTWIFYKDENIDNYSEEIKDTDKTKCIKRLFVFLKDYEINEFISTSDFKDVLMELDLDYFWENKINDLKEVIATSPSSIPNVDLEKETFIKLLSRELRENKDNFISEIDHIVNALISCCNAQDFDFNEFKSRIYDCGYSYEEINQMQCIKREDISEMFQKNPEKEVLPEGIDYQKYQEIIDQTELPTIMFQYIFVCENILRKFIIKVLKDNEYPSIDSIGNDKLSKKIKRRKRQESTQHYLPVRGDHDIYYLDLIDLKNIFINLWNDCFDDKFDRQSWICERLKSLYSIRNRVAHNSSYLTKDELKSVETRCREIIKQIDKFIN